MLVQDLEVSLSYFQVTHKFLAGMFAKSDVFVLFGGMNINGYNYNDIRETRDPGLSTLSFEQLFTDKTSEFAPPKSGPLTTGATTSPVSSAGSSASTSSTTRLTLGTTATSTGDVSITGGSLRTTGTTGVSTTAVGTAAVSTTVVSLTSSTAIDGDGARADSESGDDTGLIVGLVVGLVGLCLLLIAVILFFVYRQKKKEGGHADSVSMKLTGSTVIKDITIERRLGGGNFGDVYKGEVI